MDHRAVARAAAAAVPALHDAGEAFALARADDVDAVARLEAAHGDRVAGLHLIEAAAEFAYDRLRRRLQLLEVAAHRLGEMLELRVLEAEDRGVVAVLVGRPQLDDRARAGRDHGDRHVAPVIREHVRHADLTADDALHDVLPSSSLALTPSARCRRQPADRGA